MQLGLIAVSWTGGVALLARVALIVAMVSCLAAPLVARVWSLRSRRPGPEDPVDLDALWQHYKRGEISWDDYLRGEVEGARGLVGTRAELPKAESLEECTANDFPAY